jgi:alpha-mannosidase
VLSENGKGNLIRIFEDLGDSEGFLKSKNGESNRWTGQFWDVDSDPEIELIEEGPVRQVLQVRNKFELARFTRRIILYQGIPRIDFVLYLDWEGKNKMVKVIFPLSVSSPFATYEIPYGIIRRPSEGEEHVAQKWVDISDDNYGISLLNDSRYGHDITENEIRLSVLRCPDKPVRSLDNVGVHTIRYSLYPHEGNPQQANSMQKGYEFNYPFYAVRSDVHTGELPASYSFVQITPDNLIMTVLKKAEDSEDLIFRCFETKGEKCSGEVVLAKEISPDAIHKIDLQETALEDIKTNGKSFRIDAGPYSIESFKLIIDPF